MENIFFLALVISFIVGVILCPLIIPVLHKMKFGQYIREEGPEAHLKKSGTPTMGGIMILAAMIAGTVFFIAKSPESAPVLIFTVLFGLIGLTDDALKLKKRQSEGLKSWQKMALQLIVTVALVLYVALLSGNGTSIIIPFAGEFNIGGWYYPLAFIAVLGTENGANFTDGLDGLASSVTAVIAAFFTFAALLMGSGTVPASLALIGALMAFLIFNAYPAKVFMGDTGSLGLGGYVAAVALMMKMPIFLIIVAFIYVAEILSVMIQVSVFKATHGKRRFFKMTPIHHHFELSGWSETRVVTAFTLITVLLCILGYAGLTTAI